MEKHPIESLMGVSMDNIKDMVDVNTVIGDAVQIALSGTTGLGSLAGSLVNTGYNIYANNRAYEADRADTAWNQQMQEKQLQNAQAQQNLYANMMNLLLQQQQDTAQKAQNMAQYGDFSGYLGLGYTQSEIDQMQKYQYVVVNDELELAYAQLSAIATAEKQRTNRYFPIIEAE